MESLSISKLDWAKMDGLIPAIIQDATTKSVLMLGYMNKEALAATLTTGYVHFFSRSKKRLWQKGQSSGHKLRVESIAPDCDDDCLLIQAEALGPTCHLQTLSCFTRTDEEKRQAKNDLRFLASLPAIIEARLAEQAAQSYTWQLWQKGVKRIAQKVGEEGVEVALAATEESPSQLIEETADLLYHLILLLRAKGASLESVSQLLAKRYQERQQRNYLQS